MIFACPPAERGCLTVGAVKRARGRAGPSTESVGQHRHLAGIRESAAPTCSCSGTPALIGKTSSESPGTHRVTRLLTPCITSQDTQQLPLGCQTIGLDGFSGTELCLSHSHSLNLRYFFLAINRKTHSVNKGEEFRQENHWHTYLEGFFLIKAATVHQP